MGYNTRFFLSWTVTSDWKPATCGHDNAASAKFCQECGVSLAPASVDKVIGDYIEEHLDFLPRNGGSTDTIREDMRKMSSEIPNVIFHLTGEGENAGDLWDLYALSGRTQKHKAEIVRKPPDPKGWR